MFHAGCTCASPPQVCFDRLVSELSSAASELEREALPALDMLTKRVRIEELEGIRRIKNKLVRLKTRIESVCRVRHIYVCVQCCGWP